MPEDSYIGPQQHMLILGGLLLAAVILIWAPDTVLGVHYQCLLSRITGIRCPFCGMTRDFILMSSGILPRHNPASLFVAIVAYIGYPLWILIATFRGPRSLYMSREMILRFLPAVMAVLIVCNNVIH